MWGLAGVLRQDAGRAALRGAGGSWGVEDGEWPAVGVSEGWRG